MPYYQMRDGAKLYVRSLGRGEPCVLVHGLALDSRQWLPLIWPHVLGHRFLLPDLRGFGWSRQAPLRSADPYAQYVEDIADLLAQWDYPAVKLGGLSLGALVGLQYLATAGTAQVSHYLHIDHPAHLVLEDTPDIISRELLSLGQALIGLTDEARYAPDRPLADLPADYRALYFAVLSTLLQHSLDANYQKLAARVVLNLPLAQTAAPWVTSADSWYAVVTCLRAYLSGRFDVRPALPGLNIPVTCMIGLHNDLFHLRDLLAVPDSLPQSRLVEFTASSHLIPVSEPVKFQREFQRFLDA